MKKTILALFILYFYGVQQTHAQSVVINEILASNNAVNEDEDGDHEDWVELYNTGSSVVNLNGYGFSDNSDELYKWVFPNVTIAPGQYMLVWCSDKNRTIAGSPLHTNFKIGAGGESIMLTTASGINADTAPAAQQQPNISFGRQPNGAGSFFYLDTVTPNGMNSGSGYSNLLEPPTFSQNGGFYTAPLAISLSTSEPGATIIYTLDGSEPDLNNLSGTTYQYKNQYAGNPGEPTGPLLSQNYITYAYNNAIPVNDRTAQPNEFSAMSSTYDYDPSLYMPDFPVNKSTVIRSRVIKPGGLPSKIQTHTYFVSAAGSNWFSLPVVSLTTPEINLFDYNNGIYTAGIDFDVWRQNNPSLYPSIYPVGNYHRHGEDHEKKGNISYFVSGVEVLNQDVGIRIRGNSTRRYPSKSLTIYARPELGDDNLSYPFFSDLNDDNFKRITLSNSGNDFKETMFRDALAQEICKSLHTENQNYQPAITFINGEYWGILNIRERYDNEYFERVYGIDDVDLLEKQGDTAEEGDTVHYQAMINFVENNSMTNESNYNYVKTLMDTESFIDYYVANIYLDNTDWPMNNIVYWRKRTSEYIPDAPYGHDGRWRWAFHDMDKTFATDSNNFSHNQLADATSTTIYGGSYQWSTLLFRKLLENENFKNEFVSRFADLMNSVFLPTRVVPIINSMKAAIEPEIMDHIDRWKTPLNLNLWQTEISTEVDFANDRTPFQRDHIREKFGIASNIDLTVNVSSNTHGYVKVNTINITSTTSGISENPYPWTGVYFSGIPITLQAVANEGYIFSHWSGASASTEAVITINAVSSISLTAHFIPDALAIQQQDGIMGYNVYPNPTDGILYINGISRDTEYRIYAVDGRLVILGKLEKSATQINIETFESGIYFITLSNEFGAITKRVIKK